MEIRVIGEPCGYHGPYIFYKGIRISPITNTERNNCSNPTKNNNCLDAIDHKTAELLRSNDTIIKSIKNEYDDTDSTSDSLADLPLQRKYNKTELKPKLSHARCNYKKPLVLRLGDCIPVRPWSDSPIACLAELRMVWRDKNEQCYLASLRLYFLPENTPMGRNCHGEDEVLAIAERVVIKVDDLLNWCDDSINWTYGLRANTLLTPNIKDEKTTKDEELISAKLQENVNEIETSSTATQIHDNIQCSNIRSLKNTKLDFSDIEREKDLYSRTNVAVISFPRYCRYRATLKRLEGVSDVWLRNTLVQALCGFVSYGPDTRVMFCKETFEYPELETHELLCNHLAPKLKGRPRGRRKKIRSDSPSSRIRCDSAGSDSCDSEISACSVEKVYSKYSPLYVKPEFKQGKQVLVTRPQLRYNPRPARSNVKSESNQRSRRTTTQSDSSDSNESDSNSNTTNDDDNDDDEDDDDDNESSEESEFIQKLMDFHEAQNSQIPKVFWNGLKRLNLLAIYQKVRQMGGYEVVTEQKMWKYLFGVDSGYNSISRKKYERAILPYEKYENEQITNQVMRFGHNNVDLNWISNRNLSKDNSRRLTEADICEIQRHLKWKEAQEKDPNLRLEMSPGSLPVTVIVGNNKKTSSPSKQFKIQQPHTTITVHQTTIHPQTSTENNPPRNPIQITNQIQIQQITVQPSTSRENANNAYNLFGNKRKTSNDDFGGCNANDFVANHLAKLGKTTSLRHVRVKSDRTKDYRSNNPSPPIGSITVSAIKPIEKENIPYSSGSRATTITPLINNKSLLFYPSPITDVINLEESDNESGDSSPTSQAHLYSIGNTLFPNMKKRKLDILRQGGLEVTAISNTAGPLTNQIHNSHSVSLNVPPSNISKGSNSKLQSLCDNALTDSQIILPIPKFQSKCIYRQTECIYSNPKDLIPLPAQSTEYNCIDLTVEKCESSLTTLPIGLHLPQSTTIQKAHSGPTGSLTTPNRLPMNHHSTGSNLTSTSSQSRLTPSAALAAQKITDPNLQITLVPGRSNSSTSSHSSRNTSHINCNQNNKDKTNENNADQINSINAIPKSIFDSKLSSLHSTLGQTSNQMTGSLATEPTILNVPNLSTMNDLKINQLLLQNFLNQTAAANAQATQTSKESNASNSANSNSNANPNPNPNPNSNPNPFLPMLDPIYLSSIYNNPNLFFQQPLPQELLQLYKNFPQGLGIPISKS